MFTELAPLLTKRGSIVITIIPQPNGLIRAIVMPAAGPIVKDPSEEENTALTWPSQLDGTPEALDAGLAAELLTKYVEQHAGIEAQVAKMRTETETALAAIAEANKSKIASKGKSSTPAKSTTTSTPAAIPATPAPPPAPSLFDTLTPAAPADEVKPEPPTPTPPTPAPPRGDGDTKEDGTEAAVEAVIEAPAPVVTTPIAQPDAQVAVAASHSLFAMQSQTPAQLPDYDDEEDLLLRESYSADEEVDEAA